MLCRKRCYTFSFSRLNFLAPLRENWNSFLIKQHSIMNSLVVGWLILRMKRAPTAHSKKSSIKMMEFFIIISIFPHRSSWITHNKQDEIKSIAIALLKSNSRQHPSYRLPFSPADNEKYVSERNNHRVRATRQMSMMKFRMGEKCSWEDK